MDKILKTVPEDIRPRVCFKGNLILAEGVFTEQTHLFDENRNELGYVSFPGTEFETWTETSREWDPNFFDVLRVQPLAM